MRVLYVHQHFATPAGSTGTRSYEFGRALVEQGHQVTMLCGAYALNGLNLPFDEAKGWSRGKVDGIDVIALPLAYSNRASLLRRAMLFLRFAMKGTGLAFRSDYDLLFATSTPLTAAIPGIATKICRRKKTFVFEVRDLWPELPRALGMKNPVALWGMSLLEWLGYRASDACVALSPGISAGIERRSALHHPIAMIPNGCDLDLFHPAKREVLAIPEIRPGDFVAGFTGAHGKANGLDAVLDAAAELKRRNRSDVKFAMFGDGNQKDRLVAEARDRGLNNVIFCPPVKKTEIARITASFDCGLMILEDVPAFYHGTSPNKFFDYISAGIPVINNYPGWLATLIAENHCGLAIRPRDPGAFADALTILADDRERAAKFGANARQLAEREFSRTSLAARFVAFLEECEKNR